MIVIDTNVLSEVMRSTPDEAVVSWLSRQSPDQLYTTSISKAEILFGIAAMPLGRRRTALAHAAYGMFSEDWAGRILPFDEMAAQHYAEIAADRRRSGRRMEILDAQIAAIARAVGAMVATRNIRDFQSCGLAVANPWATA